MELDSSANVSLMAFHNPDDLRAKRQRAAQLLKAVLDERIEPRIAINRWPESNERPDPSLNCAYQALWHFESDEDKQKNELFYMDAQLELLRQMVGFLKEGKDLPLYIIRMYSPSQPIRFFYPRSWWEESWRLLCRSWQEFMAYWQQIWHLCLSSKH
jgi:hypothetical protein